MDDSRLNFIIAGIGGQGINSLAKVLAEFLKQLGYACQFTVHKGGAQSLGTVFAEFRVLKAQRTQQKPVTLGQGIPKGKLDFLIALEPWEALRHVTLAHANTRVWVEEKRMPLFVERSTEREIELPKTQLDKLPLTIHWRSYRDSAEQQTGTAKMANYYAGLDCVIGLKQSLNNIEEPLFDTLFFTLVKKSVKPETTQ